MSSDLVPMLSQTIISNDMTFAVAVLLVTRVPMIVADLFVLILTWKKTYRQYREARALSIKSPLTTCLIKDGTIYFSQVSIPIAFIVPLLTATTSILLALNFSQLMSIYFNSISSISSFTGVMPQILICRLMMNLRQLSLGRSATSEVKTSQQLVSLHMPTFNNDATPSFMGNIGEPLDHDQDDRGDDVHVSKEQPVPRTEEELDV
ncbi:uncharacterized protein PHACADRAFT_206452 [Phanerochaete carnosa HHB-10118-sp]|uniref:Uncharacterized protein n=1 Tax=Phanerochaete carnosa (strain HHB-10118-sp) TaxID=650164 RepID=K5W127_PHACS|nr:uncharacterized protein PHACADRAFT_206452 [Phanerochaete carnosa HHB-10118-sp]EKM57553.1 hypothetical protein PHACADRAFT_206452 [Phanerochaete carnosa HHB-10118-sp]